MFKKKHKLKLETIEVPSPKVSVLRESSIISGMVLMIIGGLISLTILFFMVGWPIFAIGAALFYYSQPSMEIDCPACGSINKSLRDFGKIKCTECTVETIVVWKKEKILSD